jgi:hypothetical protein
MVYHTTVQHDSPSSLIAATVTAAADAELERLKPELHTLAAPEQFYGDNCLKLTHEASGTTIRWAGNGTL